MEKDKEKTIVIFRTWKHGHFKGDVDALFPEQDEGHGSCGAYAHIGQHGTADYGYVISQTRPAAVDEYADFKTELEGLGYNLKVQKRFTRR